MLSQKEIDEQMVDLDREIILMLGESVVTKVSKKAWLCKKDSDMEEACKNNNLVGVQYLIENDNYYDNNNNDVDSAILFGAKYGMLDIVKLAVEEYGVDIHGEDNDDEALYIAVENNRLEIVEYLVEKGADIHTNDNHVLRYSAKGGYLDIIKFAIRKGNIAKVDIDRALCTAAQYRHLPVVKYLIEEVDADLHTNDEFPLVIAAQYRQLDTVRYFISKGANVNSSVLRTAVTTGRLDVVQCLVEAKADIHANNDEAVCKAVQYGYIDILDYLLANGANVKLALYFSAEYDKLDVMKYLLKRHDTTIYDNAIIRHAIKGGHLDIIEYVITNSGIYVHNNKWVLRYAVECKCLDIVKYLLENGAQYN